MPELIGKVFSKTSLVEPSVGLFNAVLLRIRHEQKRFLRKMKLAIAFFVFTGIGAVGIFVPVVYQFQTDLNQSGFSQFLSLLQSDFSTVAAAWQDYSFSLLDSLPLFSLMSFLAVIFVFLLSLRGMVYFYYLLLHKQFSL